jgi:mRNA interferase MazF
MVISQGEIWWADLPSPAGSGPGFRRPVVVVQGDTLNRSRPGIAVPSSTTDASQRSKSGLNPPAR